MKTSFYFVIWIIIYPLLGLLHSPWIDNNAFIVALIIVWCLSWYLNRSMPEILRYERLNNMATIMEEVYTGNIHAFLKRLSRMVTVEFITAIYLGAAFVFVLFSMVKGSADDWIALLIFGFFAFGAISRSVKLNQVYQRIRHNPTREECASAVEQAFRMDYASYYNIRVHTTPEAMLPQAPKHFKAFQIVSLIIAVVCGIFGLIYLIMSIIILAENRGAEAISGGIMYFLYGSLAAYFGIKDSVDIISYFRRKRLSNNNL